MSERKASRSGNPSKRLMAEREAMAKVGPTLDISEILKLNEEIERLPYRRLDKGAPAIFAKYGMKR